MSEYSITPLSELMGIPTAAQIINDPRGKFSFKDALFELGGDEWVEDYSYLFDGCTFTIETYPGVKEFVKKIMDIVSIDDHPFRISQNINSLIPIARNDHQLRSIFLFVKASFMAHNPSVLDVILDRGLKDGIIHPLISIMNDSFILSKCEAYRENVEKIIEYLDGN